MSIFIFDKSDESVAAVLMNFTVGVPSVDSLRSVESPIPLTSGDSTPVHRCERKWRCRVCSPHNFCIHDRRKETCGLCGGKYYCQHNKRKANCIECGGKGLCPHTRVKGSCNICLGPNYCDHKQQRRHCRTCRAMGLWVVNKEKRKWSYSSKRWLDRIEEKEKNKDLVEDKERIYQAIVVSDTDAVDAILPYDLPSPISLSPIQSSVPSLPYAPEIHKCTTSKQNCRVCSAHIFCIHDRRKNMCLPCGGSSFCVHKKRKWTCTECKVKND